MSQKTYDAKLAALAQPIMQILEALEDFAEAYQDREGAPLGKDALIGRAWADIAKGLRVLATAYTPLDKRDVFDMVTAMARQHKLKIGRKPAALLVP